MTNNVVLNIPQMLEDHPDIKEMMVASNENYSFHVLRSKLGEKIEKHYHKNWAESWFIVEGKFAVWIEGFDPDDLEFIAEPGDFIQIEKGVKHHIETLSETATRFAIFKEGVKVIYDGN